MLGGKVRHVLLSSPLHKKDIIIACGHFITLVVYYCHY